ncbi:MAG: shc 2 [Planctomycetaceae bacterium]|nr:shc 2 [Planctomycetaceae bacterium]
MPQVPSERLAAGYVRVRDLLLAERVSAGHWVGELSTSALSTATAVMALEQVRRTKSDSALSSGQFSELIAGGLKWLVEHQNADGGWGDTTVSFSNISTTMLCHAVFHATRSIDQYATSVARAKSLIDQLGGVPALRKRYGRDKTFSIPILTHCALAGLVDWREISALPFELACLPHSFYKFLRLPVVSYALPALIAIGQCRFQHRPTWNPVLRLLRNAAIQPSLKKLESIQPTSGGFLEAAPLTSFVTMSLASIGLADHPVARLGIQFLIDSVRPDGSWPIDTNLATWVTTLSINALGDDLPTGSVSELTTWLAQQQYREVHPYTQADPGGWAWTNLSGGVPDADDTPGAILAALQLMKRSKPASGGSQPTGNFASKNDPPTGNSNPQSSAAASPFDLQLAATWLLGLQNRDGGWPTFCRGWGALPFDRSAPDLTAHAIRALSALLDAELATKMRPKIEAAIRSGFRYLSKTQRRDGSWLPLWFGNQHNHDDENPTYGTARVLAAYRDTRRTDMPEYQRGLQWLLANQNADGSWSGMRGLPPSVEESSLALDIVLSANHNSEAAQSGLEWLLDRIESGTVHQQSPIGFYFAKLWYSERLYPLCFATQAMRRAVESVESRSCQNRP